MRLQNSILFITIALICASCSQLSTNWQEMEGGVWNTTFNIKYRGNLQLTDSVYQIFNNIDNTFSAFNPSSLVARVNRNEDVELTPEFIEVFNLSQAVSEASGKLFDPAAGALIKIWGFGPDKPTDYQLPPDNIIQEKLSTADITQCRIVDNHMVKRVPETEFNFSGIAKGFGCDCVASLLERNGIRDYMIEIGGEVRVSGKSPRGKEWVIQIDAPQVTTDGQHKSLSKIALGSGAVATSGNYRNFREQGDKRYGHTINPLTGLPSEGPVLSATIIAPSTTAADALATAFMLMNPVDAMALAASRNDVFALIVTDDHFSADDRAYYFRENGVRMERMSVGDENYLVFISSGFPVFVD